MQGTCPTKYMYLENMKNCQNPTIKKEDDPVREWTCHIYRTRFFLKKKPYMSRQFTNENIQRAFKFMKMFNIISL